MSNLYQGIPVIVIATLLIVFAFRMQQKQRAVWLLVLAGFILRFYCSADQFLHPWDERYHALVAKNFMTHWWVPTLYDNPILGYNNASWAVSHIWLHKQPLPMWLMAISMKLFGVNEMAMRLPSVIMTSIGIKLMYFI
ncbi:MAG: hypothetical protein EOP51_24120 [Sphingobacteriales bacterium]|nr:MAG: hypothetical protein EOP51_24120 [Sphingobacteriales bacterium]